MITYPIYDTASLLVAMRKFEEVPSYWLDLGFPNTINFDDEWIDFSKISENRKLAPLVVPTSQGKPMYNAAETVFRVKPAYLKPKDAVSASHMLRRRAGLSGGELLQPRALTPDQRYQAVVGDIQRQHREGIERFWEWMASKAIQDAAITLEDEAYPKTVVDFKRDANHTVTLVGAARWSETTSTVIEDIEDWIKLMMDAKFGGPCNRMTVGPEVWKAMRSHADVRDLLNLDLRNTSGTVFDLGPVSGLRVQRVGRINGAIEVFVYSDFYQLPDGTVVPMLDTRDVILTGPNIEGTKCFGAILDIGAQFQPLAIFPKMWTQEDPSATQVMSQSAPLMVPVNPNNTLKARVLS